MMRELAKTAHPKHLVKTFKLFKGDVVEVVGGKRDLGKRGKVLDILPKRNLIVVEDVAMQKKSMKPHPFHPNGGQRMIETPIHYSNVQLVDPVLKYSTINAENLSKRRLNGASTGRRTRKKR